MSKGLKMHAAKKLTTGDTIFSISQLSADDKGNLKCQHCSVKIQYVSEHQKQASKNPVAAYLKLWQKEEHLETCRYSVKRAVEQLVAEANDIEDNPLLERQDDGSYLFRMNILTEAQYLAYKISEDEDKEDYDEDEIFKGTTYVKTKQQLAAYFRTASGVARIRSLIEDASDENTLEDLIKIQYKDSYIKWKNFYFDDTNYHTLFTKLQNKSIDYPVAVNLTIKGSVKHNNKAKAFGWSFQSYSEQYQEKAYVPYLKLDEETLADDISDKEVYLVVGKPWASKPTDKYPDLRNFSISVFNKSQFIREVR